MREKTYRIGEAADMLHLKGYVLRFWETEFPQLVPLRTDKGQRLYTDAHIALLHRIRQLLHEQGMTIEGARRVLASAALPAYAGAAVQTPVPEQAAAVAEISQPRATAINRAVVREMREELLALRHMLTAED